MIDLSAHREPADLIDAIYEVRRSNRRDLRDQIERLLEHDEPMVREEALSLLLTKWGISTLRSKGRQLLQSDKDFGVRAHAAIGLASVADASTRRDDAALLAAVFNEAGVQPELKCACFEALSLLVGRPTLVELDDTDPKKVQDLLNEIAAMGT